MSRPIHEIESHWQRRWEEEGVYHALAEGSFDAEKFYGLVEFPYPSGDGLHVGHPRSYVAIDIVTRKKRMEGKNVLYPIGWDAFGLPTENYAIKFKVKPQDATKKNVANFKRQIQSLGVGFDWSREINTTDPEYYRWTQWQFLQFLKYGLAYKATSTINWCPSCKIGLANEEAQGGVCERCGSAVEKREKEQWMLRITKYAERLLQDLKSVNYLERIASQQVNWIGKSEGIEISYRVPLCSRVLISTGNKAKIERTKKLLADILPGVDVVSPVDLGLSVRDVAEGSDLSANATAKARLYPEVQDMPVIGGDTGLFIEGEDVDPSAPKRNALGGRDESIMTQEEKAVSMDAFYREIAKRHGGETEAYWKDVLVIRWPDGREQTEEAVRQIVLTESRHGEMDVFFPVRGLYRVKGTGKYVADQTEEEELNVELLPTKNALANLLATEVTVFTTRPDTNFGATFIAVAPESTFVNTHVDQFPHADEVKEYVVHAGMMTDEERISEGRKKTGVYTGWDAINQLTHRRMPIYVSDFVLSGVGTGALVGVPGHDARDFAFAKEMGLEVIRVVRGADGDESPIVRTEQVQEEEGVMMNSGFLDGRDIHVATELIKGHLERMGWGKRTTTYRLRDWVFSRQRYWGEPIPLVYCEACAKKKQRVLLIHGFEGSAKGNWFPWIQRELENRGFEVFSPTMTTSNHPDLETWMKELEPYAEKMGEGDIVIGHSLGAKAALHLVERSSKRFGGVFLVAGAVGDVREEDWERFAREWPSSDIGALRAFWEEKVDWSAIDARVDRKVLISSDDDPELRPYMNESVPRSWYRETWNGFGHFQRRELPELLELVLQSASTGWIPLPEDQLPLQLPDVDAYQPTDTGESPLAKIADWVNTTCPRCGGPARRETDTMPNWAGSSWYFLRYADPHNEQRLASNASLAYWLPVDLYNGGMEHTTLHLLYSRFWYKFLWDIGVVPESCGSEPYRMRRSHNMILGEGGVKMSKSKGNVVNPDEVVKQYGADVFRVYEMFIGPYDQPATWDTKGIEGAKRFLDKVWAFYETGRVSGTVSPTLEVVYHQTVKKVSEGIESLQFNTCISQLMILLNALQESGEWTDQIRNGFAQLLAPFAPHLAEELWQSVLGHDQSVHRSGWPKYDDDKLASDTFELVVQVNGKVRDKFTADREISKEDAMAKALGSEKVQKWIEGKEIKRAEYIKGKLVSISV